MVRFWSGVFLGGRSRTAQLAVLLLLVAVVHILMAIWVYADNRKRGAGYGLWIVITLLSGFFGALVYAVIRLGDLAPSGSRPGGSSSMIDVSRSA